ncbi:17 kDa surface antigen [Caenispirillum salinarum AK4]|uniref:17 kDa surface antigen n=1 Tax=Caenispirillum salinarum AK4 TaxID=1238182 RepID=K9HC13_9PROT|nr:hypothetical protein [Caenispirillum salinarum]EKV28083.1 17 kDa surface antigen [Caenispirillum salinarum AK4]
MQARRRAAALALAAVMAAGSVMAAAPANAEPPPWAPAHGWRAKHGHKHKGPDVVYIPVPTVVERGGRDLPYGFGRGTCDRSLIDGELIGNVLGAAAGGLAGSRFGEGKGKLAAVIGGTLLGTLVGGAVGRSMDPVDRACTLTALEHVPDGRAIRWTGGSAGSGVGTPYRLVPQDTFRDGGRTCRTYTTTASVDGRPEVFSGTACRREDGAWEIVN